MDRLNGIERLPGADQTKAYSELATGRKVLINRRASARRTVRWRALLVRDDAKQSRECTLLDISETGARIALQDTSDLPELFAIKFTRRDRPQFICRLVWKSATDIGVAFVLEMPTPENHPLQPGMSREEAVNDSGFEY